VIGEKPWNRNGTKLRFCSLQQTKNYESHVPTQWQPQIYLDGQRSKCYYYWLHNMQQEISRYIWRHHSNLGSRNRFWSLLPNVRHKKKQKSQNPEPIFKVSPLRDSSTKWPYQCQLTRIVQTTLVSEGEWTKLQHILEQVEFENLGHRREWQRKKTIKDWKDHIKKVIKDKRDVIKKFLLTGTDKIDYSHKRAITKWEVYKNYRNSWETYKILKKLGNNVEENIEINNTPHGTWFNHFQNL